MDQLIKEISHDFQQTAHETGISQLASNVEYALHHIDREQFVPPAYKHAAYEDSALPLTQGQTISQPFIVALMTQLLDVHRNDTILEVGTGSGYQAAVLSLLVQQVHSIEIIKELADSAVQRFTDLSIPNISVHVGNGHHGLPDLAPFDGIIVTAASPEIPAELVAQLKPLRNMVIPIGKFDDTQMLTLVHRDHLGDVHTKNILPVRFVPMQG